MSTWIKLDDNFWRNPKVLAAGEDAATLHIQGLCYCSDSETNGLIPTAALRMLTAKKDARTLARILVREGLWIETATGWEVHDYLKHQRSKAQIENEREKARARKARSRSSHAVSPTVTDGHVTQPETDTETDNPTPTPPPQTGVTPIEWVPVGDGDHYIPRIDPAQVETLRAVKSQVFGHTQQQEPPHA